MFLIQNSVEDNERYFLSSEHKEWLKRANIQYINDKVADKIDSKIDNKG